MKIAIVGAGLAGLSSAWHLRDLKPVLFDPKGIGGGASGVSTGLLHPFPGRRALRSWGSEEGMKASQEMLQIAEHALGRTVCEKTGIFRPAVSAQQKADFPRRAEEDNEAIWQEHPVFGPGLWIPGGIAVYSKLYLEGLWKAVGSEGVTFVKEAVDDLDALKAFDAILLTTGADSLRFAPHLPLEATKGQTLLCRWLEKLPFSLASQGHITPTEDPSICQIGSTYEHGFTSLEPDKKAIEELLAKAAKFYPPARGFEVIEVRAGVRISQPKGYRPVVEQIAPKTWVFTGLGSRGMLYHAWLGGQIARMIRGN